LCGRAVYRLQLMRGAFVRRTHGNPARQSQVTVEGRAWRRMWRPSPELPLSRSCALLLSLPAVVCACGGGWHRVESAPPRALPARTQVQVWHGERVTLLHAVGLESDTIDGVPFTKAPTCDSCRVRLALGAVDSLRTGSKERGVGRTAGVVLILGTVWAFLMQGVGGD
jgi:hypothetical protein